MTERRIDVPGGTVRSWRVAGSGDGTPMLFLHGGPGGTCDGFDTITGLADGRDLIMFDQLGSPSSKHTGAAADLWTMDRFCAEVDAVRAAWQLDELVLFGHSWGGWLSIEYLARRPDGVVGAVLCDTAASFASFAASIARRIAQLSDESQAAIAAARAAGDFDSIEYRSAALEFYAAFVVRHVDTEGIAARVFDRQRTRDVFRHMQGNDELHTDGSLAAWDRRPSLASIDVPALVMVGRHDHMDPETAAELAGGLPTAELAILEGSSHCPHLEQPDEMMDRLRTWLARFDA